MTCPKTIVISLPHAEARRREITRIFNGHDLNFTFFDAVDGATLSKKKLVSVYDSRGAFSRLGRDLHPNEIGCALSHLTLWEQLVKSEANELLVFEDDITLGPEFKFTLSQLDTWMPADWQIINFAYDIAKPINLVQVGKLGDQTLSRCQFKGTVARCSAYLIRKTAAQQLLKHAYPLIMPIDDLMGNEMFSGGMIYGFVPRVAIWNDAHPSTIWRDETPQSFADKSRSGFKGIVRRITRRFLGAVPW